MGKVRVEPVRELARALGPASGRGFGRGSGPASGPASDRAPGLSVAWVMASFLALFLAGCGGGGGSGTPTAAPPPVAPQVVEKPDTRAAAARFLAQATFGPTEASIDRLMAIGYAAWIDEQFAQPTQSHRAHWEAADAVIKAADATRSAGQQEVFDSFWRQATTGPDALRQRVVWALSQVFVVSMVDSTVGNEPRANAAWLDMLSANAFGNYRSLIEDVSRHPLMGAYLSHLRNQKADTRTGRVPDENYSREVMQLFAIGVVKLDESGRAQAEATYTPADISGLARVFTGFSWDCPDFPQNSCFSSGSYQNRSDPDRWFKPMRGYPAYHSTEEKRFLDVVIPVQATADPDTSLRIALDGLAAHRNVGPFLGKQLIQRLTSSNPTEAYVAAVSRVFDNNGAGVRGDMKAVIKAILMHPEARVQNDASGKLREPVLRLAALLRAFPHTSETGGWRVGNTDNPGTALGQTVLRSPSVFNFYRPGYLAPGTRAAAANLATPEMQLVHETTTAGYVNYMRDGLSSGFGLTAPSNRRDVQADFSAELALADQPGALVDRVLAKLVYRAVPVALRSELVAAVTSIAIPALAANGSNQAAVDTAKRNRVNTALLLTLVAPEFIVAP
jgi:uncharacterized protein (DUF1800 family)